MLDKIIARVIRRAEIKKKQHIPCDFLKFKEVTCCSYPLVSLMFQII